MGGTGSVSGYTPQTGYTPHKRRHHGDGDGDGGRCHGNHHQTPQATGSSSGGLNVLA